MVRSLGPTSTLLVGLIIPVGLAHHVDHVLRVDHSGWPFLPQVTPLTFSFAAYPILLIVLLARRLSIWVRWALIAASAALTIGAHIVLETPWMQYGMWAYNRTVDPALAALGPIQNLFCIQSPQLGIVSVTISMTLNLLLLAATASILRDATRRMPERV